MNPIVISPSMLSADFSDLANEVKRIEASGAEWLHCDIMDGHFVPNISFGPDVLKQLRPKTNLFFDVHLMITHPVRYIRDFARAGADLITIAVEAEENTDECIELVRQYGKKVGIVLSPNTPVERAFYYLDKVDMVLLMSVFPGFGGQSYIADSTEKIRALRKAIGDRPVRLEIDGGVNFDNLSEIVEAGADTIVSGSCLFKGDMKANVTRFKEIIDQCAISN